MKRGVLLSVNNQYQKCVKRKFFSEKSFKKFKIGGVSGHRPTSITRT
jgi:hypothetical protein